MILAVCLSVHSSSKVISEALARIGASDSELFMHSGYVSHEFSMYLPLFLLEKPAENENIANSIHDMVSKNEYQKLLSFLYTGKSPKTLKSGPGSFNKWRFEGPAPDFLTQSADEEFYNDVDKYLQFLDVFDTDNSKIRDMSAFAEYISKSDSAGIVTVAEELMKKDLKMLVFDAGNNIIDDDADLIIDRGGDDIYRLSNPNTIIIDMGGDDTYIAQNNEALACAKNGFALIADLSGNDRYFGKDYSVACGINGIGMLLDLSGDDIYKAGYACIGAGFNGAGILIDRYGNDQYVSEGYSQGFGFVLGTGIIADFEGSDIYSMSGGIKDHREPDYSAHLSQGFGYGIRDIACGGTGILFDMKGNDKYSGEYFVQGSSYWLAYGLLYDRQGNDDYSARRYSQGAGTHFTTGVLIDKAGNDNYISWGVSQGCGHDYASGLLMDYAGNDTYTSEWLSQGAGNANGLGLLADFGGADSYVSKRESGGYSQEYRNSFSIGIMFDNIGDDTVNGRPRKQAMNSIWGFSYYDE